MRCAGVALVTLWVTRVTRDVGNWSRGMCPYRWGELLFLGSGLCVVCPLRFVLHAGVRLCFLSRGEQGLRGNDASHLWGWGCSLLALVTWGLFSLPCAMAVVFSFTCGDGGAVSVFLAGSPVSSPGSGEACLDSVKHKSVRDRVMRCVESCEEM